jgi:hypothetical protein
MRESSDADFDSFAAAEAGVIEGRSGDTRTPEIDRRVAFHEAAHCLTARAQGAELGGCTIDPRGEYSGLTWGPNYSAKFSRANTAQILGQLDTLKPRDGEPRNEDGTALYYQHVFCRVIELTSGSEAELLIFGDAWPATSDRTDEVRLARLVTTSEASATAFIAACAAEARSILQRYEHVLCALSKALLLRRTLDAEAIDKTIVMAIADKAAADEAEWRRQWARRIENAKNFRDYDGSSRATDAACNQAPVATSTGPSKVNYDKRRYPDFRFVYS